MFFLELILQTLYSFWRYLITKALPLPTSHAACFCSPVYNYSLFWKISTLYRIKFSLLLYFQEHFVIWLLLFCFTLFFSHGYNTFSLKKCISDASLFLPRCYPPCLPRFFPLSVYSVTENSSHILGDYIMVWITNKALPPRTGKGLPKITAKTINSIYKEQKR